MEDPHEQHRAEVRDRRESRTHRIRKHLHDAPVARERLRRVEVARDPPIIAHRRRGHRRRRRDGRLLQRQLRPPRRPLPRRHHPQRGAVLPLAAPLGLRPSRALRRHHRLHGRRLHRARARAVGRGARRGAPAHGLRHHQHGRRPRLPLHARRPG